MLRQSVENERAAQKPAAIAVTIPKDGPEHAEVALDMGASLGECGVASPGAWTASAKATGEIHRKTSTAAPQYTYGAGLVGDVTVGDGFNRLLSLQLSGAWHADRVRSTTGLLSWVDASGVFKALGLNAQVNLGWLKLYWAPTVGLELEQIFAAANPENQGNSLRAVGRVDLVLTATLNEQQSLELQAGAAYRHVVYGDRTSEPTGTGIPLLTASLILWLDSNQRFGLSADYLNGADPRQGQALDQYLVLGAKLKLDVFPSSK